MSRGFVNHLKSLDNFRDYRHASHLYLDNDFAFTPKAGWIYYVTVEINPNLEKTISDPEVKEDFISWYEKYRGQVGLLAKLVDAPNFNIDTETLNQYNKRTVIQTGIKYSPINIVFHDDMSNMTTNLWKSYYHYYYGDGVDSVKKYRGNDVYAPFTNGTSMRYGLNNQQSEPFFRSFTIYQLHQRKYTSFKIINPLIKSWKHESLDQTSGNKMLSSTMQIEYETVLYDTDADNEIKNDEPGFDKDHYDNTPSPLYVNAMYAARTQHINPTRKEDVFGGLNNPKPSPLDKLNTVISQPGDSSRSSVPSASGANSGQLRSITSSKTPNGQILTEPLSEIGKRNPAGISVPKGDARIPENPANARTVVIPQTLPVSRGPAT